MHSSCFSRHSRGDHPPAEAAVDFEIRVGGEEKRLREDFGETDQTGVGDAHGDIGVFVQEIEDRDEGILMERRNPEGSPAAGEAEGGATLGCEQVVRFGKNRLAGDPWRRMKAGLLDGPRGVLIVLPPEGDEKRRINDDGISRSRSLSGIPFSQHSCLGGHLRRFRSSPR